MARQYNLPTDIKLLQFTYPQLEDATFIAQLVPETPESRGQLEPHWNDYFDLLHFFKSYDQRTNTGKEIGYFVMTLDPVVFSGFGTCLDGEGQGTPKLREWPSTAFKGYVITSLAYMDLRLTNKDVHYLPEWARNNCWKVFNEDPIAVFNKPTFYLTEEQINGLRGWK